MFLKATKSSLVHLFIRFFYDSKSIFFALQLPCDKRTWRDTDLNFKVKKEKERRKKKEMSEFVDKEFIVALALTDTVYDA